MKLKVIDIILLLLLVTPAFSAVLTDDLQVVSPTGQPAPYEPCICRVEVNVPTLILHWDSNSGNIVFMRDHFSKIRAYDQYSLEKLSHLEDELNLKSTTDFKMFNGSFDFSVVLE